jgi:hypothetical protein
MMNHYYIANCISGILRAECSDRNIRQRELDLAEAVRIAASLGEKAAHTFLVQLAQDAKAGKYVEE